MPHESLASLHVQQVASLFGFAQANHRKTQVNIKRRQGKAALGRDIHVTHVDSRPRSTEDRTQPTVTAGLAVDDRDVLVLQQLREAFSEWDIGSVDGVFYARILTGGPLLAAFTLGGLASALLEQTDRRASTTRRWRSR